MATMTIILGEPLFCNERAHTALQFVLAALQAGHAINMFLFEEAVHLPRLGHRAEETAVEPDNRMSECKALLKAAIEKGAQVKVCGVCAKERALSTDELMDGATVGAMQELVRWILEGDKVVSF